MSVIVSNIPHYFDCSYCVSEWFSFTAIFRTSRFIWKGLKLCKWLVIITYYIRIIILNSSLTSDTCIVWLTSVKWLFEWMACGGLPFPGTGCPIPDVDYLCLLCIDFYVWDAVSTFNHLPRMFLSTDFAFWITDWTCCHGPYLHAILRIISRGVSGLATDSPCGVWGRGWTTCLLHDSPLFGSHFKMRVGM